MQGGGTALKRALSLVYPSETRDLARKSYGSRSGRGRFLAQWSRSLAFARDDNASFRVPHPPSPFPIPPPSTIPMTIEIEYCQM